VSSAIASQYDGLSQESLEERLPPGQTTHLAVLQLFQGPDGIRTRAYAVRGWKAPRCLQAFSFDRSGVVKSWSKEPAAPETFTTEHPRPRPTRSRRLTPPQDGRGADDRRTEPGPSRAPSGRWLRSLRRDGRARAPGPRSSSGNAQGNAGLATGFIDDAAAARPPGAAAG
jgi:hypothetical protein